MLMVSWVLITKVFNWGVPMFDHLAHLGRIAGNTRYYMDHPTTLITLLVASGTCYLQSLHCALASRRLFRSKNLIYDPHQPEILETLDLQARKTVFSRTRPAATNTLAPPYVLGIGDG